MHEDRFPAWLIDVGGEPALRAAPDCRSVDLEAGATRSAAQLVASGLLAVEAGRLLVTAGATAGGNRGRRLVLVVGEPGTILPPLAGDERLEALMSCRITVISRESLQRLLELPLVAAAIVESLSDGLRDRQDSIRACLHVRHQDRVRDKLIQLARLHGRVVPGGIRIDLALTQKLLADMVGSARETVSLALAELAREGFVRRDGHGYRLLVTPEELAEWPPAAAAEAAVAC